MADKKKLKKVLSLQDYLSVSYADTYYQLAQRHAHVPRLSQKQQEALRVFNALASSDEVRMDFWLQPGDLQLLNNLTQQHQRSSFVVRTNPKP